MHKYGDAVVYVKKTPDGDLAINAIVLAASMHTPLRGDRQFRVDAQGEKLPAEEHLDLAFPVPTATGDAPKSRDLGEIFRPANDVRKDTGFGGWREPFANLHSVAAKQGKSLSEIDAEAGEHLAEQEADDIEDTHAEEIADAANNHGQATPTEEKPAPEPEKTTE